MPLSIPSLDTSSQGAPPLPPGPHPSMLASGQPQYQHNPQQIPPQGLQQQMPSFPQPPPNMAQPQSHMHPQFALPPSQMHQNMLQNNPSSMPGSMQMPPASMPMGMPGPMGIQNATNQMVPQMQPGHFMGMNPPVGGFMNGAQTIQGQQDNSGPQMYPPCGAYNRPQGGQMPLMPGLNPYQPANQGGMPQPPLSPGPPPPQT